MIFIGYQISSTFRLIVGSFQVGSIGLWHQQVADLLRKLKSSI